MCTEHERRGRRSSEWQRWGHRQAGREPGDDVARVTDPDFPGIKCFGPVSFGAPLVSVWQRVRHATATWPSTQAVRQTSAIGSSVASAASAALRLCVDTAFDKQLLIQM